MKYEIKTGDGQTDIVIFEIDDASEKDRVLDALGSCRSGKCGCPSNQYDRVDRFEIEFEGDSVILTLGTKKGKSMDVDEIRKCLDWVSNPELETNRKS